MQSTINRFFDEICINDLFFAVNAAITATARREYDNRTTIDIDKVEILNYSCFDNEGFLVNPTDADIAALKEEIAYTCKNDHDFACELI